MWKNYEFRGFDDKHFHDLVKGLIKNQEELNFYLDLLGMDLKYFIKLLSYVVPEVFTHNIIKLVRTNYLNIAPKPKKK